MDQIFSYQTPVVFVQGDKGERAYDVFSYLMKNRVIFLNHPVYDEVASIICAQLLHLDAASSDEPIKLYINSPGGLITAGLAIYDTMQMIEAPVHTFCIGSAYSMGSFLLAAGEPGFRTALPNSRIMIHQPSGGSWGTALDIQIHAREIMRIRTRVNEIMAKHTGKTVEQIEVATDRDNYFFADEAKEFGLVDRIEGQD